MGVSKQFVQPSGDILGAAGFILSGGIGGVPTETVYGLAANALDERAVRKIFSAKGRPFIDPLIVHVCDMAMAEKVAFLTDRAKILAKRFWPGPLTLVLKKRDCIPGIVTAGMDTVAVRMPSHSLMRKFIEACGCPIAAPSANPFGYVSPTTAEHVTEQLADKIDFILDGGKCAKGVESTILMLSESGKGHKLLRAGPVPVEELEAALAEEIDASPKHNEAQPQAPGMLKSHYSPHSRLTLFDCPSEVENLRAENVIFFTRPTSPESNHFWLSENSDLSEAAANLYSLLRKLDKISPNGFFCQRVPNTGIGVAINDRLSRAESKL